MAVRYGTTERRSWRVRLSPFASAAGGSLPFLMSSSTPTARAVFVAASAHDSAKATVSFVSKLRRYSER